MKYSNFIIGIDIDDTIEFLLDAWLKWLNTRYDKSVRVEDVTEWDMCKFYPDLTREQIMEPLYKNSFWDTVKVNPEAVIYVKKLFEEGYRLYICTNSNSRTLDHKLDVIVRTYFPYINNKHIIVTANKQLVNFDILIDDNPDNLIDAPYAGILYSCPHNKYFSCHYYNRHHSKSISRCTNWKEIYDTVHKLTTNLF